MAKYDITYQCGHAGRVNIDGPQKDRTFKINREATKICPPCYAKSQEEKREKAVAEAKMANTRAQLAQLIGSEKQIAWAEQIRANMLEGLRKFKTNLAAARATMPPDRVEAMENALTAIAQENHASWWIDRSRKTIIQIVREEVEKGDAHQ